MLNKQTFRHLNRIVIPVVILSLLFTAFGAAIRFINISSNDKEKLVNLGEEFTLKKGEAAKIRGLNVTLTVTGFIYSPCPEGSQCFWSGLAVEYELSVNGNIYKSSFGNLPSEAPYRVFIKDSDYKTYATLVIDTGIR